MYKQFCPSLFYSSARVGAKHLARNDSEVVGLVGMGVQARTQAMALKEVFARRERIFLKPIGMAHEDVAFASRIYERAKKEG